MNQLKLRNDEAIIDIVIDIYNSGSFVVETVNESVLVKLLELRGTPIAYKDSLRDIDSDYQFYLTNMIGMRTDMQGEKLSMLQKLQANDNFLAGVVGEHLVFIEGIERRLEKLEKLMVDS